MKILICGDIHWSTYSSIVRSRGKHFSTRLEYLISSLGWVEQISKENNCEEEIFLGDFFDHADLSSEELTALSEVEWNKSTRLKHFIVGNHESGVSSLVYNSTQALHKIGVIEDEPYTYHLDDKTDILFLPYITEGNRLPLEEYIDKESRRPNTKLLVCSHNDIKDFQMGMFLSKTGFSVEDIEKTCDLYINGHLHNGGWVTNTILNVGNLCGQNFSEDAFKYGHHVVIFDTDTWSLQMIENPYALNFYKIEINNLADINQLQELKSHAVLSIKCNESFVDKVRETIKDMEHVVDYKLITVRDAVQVEGEEVTTFNTINHLEQFSKFILSREDIDINIAKEELSEVCSQCE